MSDSSEDLKKKAKKALKSILQMCTHLQALEPLIRVRISILSQNRKLPMRFWYTFCISSLKSCQRTHRLKSITSLSLKN